VFQVVITNTSDALPVVVPTERQVVHTSVVNIRVGLKLNYICSIQHLSRFCRSWSELLVLVKVIELRSPFVPIIKILQASILLASVQEYTAGVIRRRKCSAHFPI